MPKKYQPDYPYLRKVPIARVHLFTIIQFACLVMLWIVKDIKQTSILFPIMVLNYPSFNVTIRLIMFLLKVDRYDGCSKIIRILLHQN